jgi:hypothetical protein
MVMASGDEIAQARPSVGRGTSVYTAGARAHLMLELVGFPGISEKLPTPDCISFVQNHL